MPATRGASLSSRVAGVTVLTAVAAAAATAAIAIVIAHQLILSGVDTRLRGAAQALVDIIARGDEREVIREINEDGRELLLSGIRLAVYDGERLLGGDDHTPRLAPGCLTQLAGGEPLRLCAMTTGTHTVVVSGQTGENMRQLRRFGEAALIAVALTVIAALLIGRRLATRVVGPLTRLQRAVATVPDHAPGRAALGDREGWEEVDALRSVLEQLLARLDRALMQAKSFATDAAHELRTPLATMRVELELLAENAGGPEEAQRSLARVHRTLLSVSSLIERLLILALPPEADGPVGQAVAMADVVRDAVDELPAEARGRISSDLADDGVVRGDPTLFRAMVDNAIDNALKFSGAGAVVIRVASEADRVVTSFRDQGPGIPAEERSQVFQPFYRSKAARAGTVRGYGIGLALIAHVAAGNGGQASFEEVASGALLRIALPAWR